MTADMDPALTTLIGKCECAIRRGDVPHVETLHTLKQHLVTARDARYQSETDAAVRAAIEFYDQHIPVTERTSTFAALTEHIDQVRTHLEASAGQESDQVVDTATK